MNQDMAASIMGSNRTSKEQPLLAHEVTKDKVVNLHKKRGHSQAAHTTHACSELSSSQQQQNST